MAMTIENYLCRQSQPIRVFGGSPLYKPARMIKPSISINGLRKGAQAAAVNSSSSDAKRVRDWRHVMVPYPQANHTYPENWMLPSKDYSPRWPDHIRWHYQPTTCFALLTICRELSLDVDLFGVCGWASKYHDGDWEMHYIKLHMKNVNVYDPRPKW